VLRKRRCERKSAGGGVVERSPPLLELESRWAKTNTAILVALENRDKKYLGKIEDEGSKSTTNYGE